PLLGFFVNTLVLRMDLGGSGSARGEDAGAEPTVAEALAQARRRVLDAHAHQEVPFERLVDALAPRRDLSRSPLFQVLLALRNTPAEGVALPGLEVEPLVVAGTSAKFDLTLNLGAGTGAAAGSLVGGLEYAVDLFDPGTVESLGEELVTLLETWVADPAAPVFGGEALPPVRRRQLVVEEGSPSVEARPARQAGDAAEVALVELFRELLDNGSAGPDSDFFSLGGTSLSAVRMVARIRRDLGVSLPVATLFSHPTPAALAVLVRSRGRGAEGPLVELRPGQGRPLVLVHPIGGQVLCYAPLATRLDPRLPVVAVQADASAPVASSLEMLAARYVDALRQRGGGPYRLAGWSMGGVLAFEMARQLRAAGEEVEVLVLVDPQLPPLAAADEATLLGRFGLDLLAANPGLAPATGALDARALEGLDPRLGLDGLLRRARRRGLLPEDLPHDEVARAFDTFRHHHELLTRYRPEATTGPALLLRAGSGTVDAAGWRRLLPQVVTVDLPGDHYSLVVGAGAAELARHLSAALAASGSEPPAEGVS
ncbi:MAG: hypothetical protein KDD11_22120, partial [Acidobacteria bacterium]|nr:hypothetical protein [Acidobacteriota bacterium]